MEILFIILTVVGVVYFLISHVNETERKKLWSVYQQTIRTGNKRDALTAGRAYYAKRRGGKLSVYDEQAITNDLSTMV